MRKLFFILITLSCIASTHAQKVVKQTATQRAYARIDSLSQNSMLVDGGAVRPVWIDGENRFWYSVNKGGKTVYYEVDVEKKTKTEVATPVKDKKTDPKRAINDHSQFASPDSLYEAFVRDNNLWIKDLKAKTEYRLSYDGTSSMPYSIVRQAWSPDSRQVAATKTIKALPHKIYLIESVPRDQVQPKLHERNYFKPGDVIDVTLPALFDVQNKREIPIQTDRLRNQFSLQFTGWSPDSRSFTFEFNERGHQLYQVIAVDATTGNQRTLIEERRPDSFIYYRRNYRYTTPSGDEIIWISERDGHRHLYLFDAHTGALKNQITKGAWVVRSVDKVDPDSRTILFQASGLKEKKGEDPYNLHLCRVNFDGTGFVDLTPENANHHISYSPDGQYALDVYSRPDMPPISVVRSVDNGNVVMELERADISRLLKSGWRMPEVFSTVGRDGKTMIWGNIHRPKSFDEKRKYPIVEYIYAGPHDSFVEKDFSAYNYYCARLAELGFIVVSIDGMGTANRSKAFHDMCWRNLQDGGFPDRKEWIKAAAAKYKYMDTSRVGIYGYSAGGQSTVSALLFHGDFYKAGVSLCGCHDNRMDKIWWNEQWMGYPVGKWYDDASNVVNAHRLQGKLLLINGEMDDNVDPASTLQVVGALVKAGKEFEQYYLPGYGHGLSDRWIDGRLFDFFVRHLDVKPQLK